jgi:hypothetical protein
LVEPPSAITTGDGVLERLARHDLAGGDALAEHLDDGLAGAVREAVAAPVDGRRAAEPGSDMPSASPTAAIVLAVYMPPHAPSPGQIGPLDAVDLLAVILPGQAGADGLEGVDDRHVRPSTCPGMIEPAYRNTAARSSRAAAIIMPGSDLSQPASSTEPSSRSAIITVSTESAITSRETSEKCMPSWPIEMPSETEMVPNSSG